MDGMVVGIFDQYSYTYGDSQWGDLLTVYDGQTLTYDEVGNLTGDGQWTYTWKHGRQLQSMTKGSTTWTFTYDANGMRTGRSPGFEQSTYTYVYNGDKLSRMTVEGMTFDFTYDINGTPLLRRFLMNIGELFDFLKEEYNLSYRYQEFINCYGNNWTVQTHSFYNDSGCFTIYIEVQRGMEFWFASRFSVEREELCERSIDISSIEPQIWNKHERILGFKNPFFWWNDNKVLSTLAEALQVHLAKDNEFFGIQV